MNETQIRNERTETRDDADADPKKWADAIQNLLRIIERSEQKLGYFQNRVKQAQYMDSPNQRKNSYCRCPSGGILSTVRRVTQ